MNNKTRSAILACVVASALLRAQEAEKKPPRPAPVPVDVEADRAGATVRRLSLEDALRLGRAGNADLRAAEILPEQARLDVLFAEAGFEPELYANGTYEEADTPARNAFQPSNSRISINGTLGWRQRVITGGLYDLAYRPARFESSGSAAFPDKLFTSEFTASFRQPLLRGAWTDYNLAPIEASQQAAKQARYDFETETQDTLQRIVQAYWELVYSRENWHVVVSALEVAREQLRITEERIRVRDLAPRDRIADEAEVARRQEDLIKAENDIRTREDDLRRLLFDGSDPDLWRVNLRPVSEIDVTPAEERIDYESLVEVALANRPDLRSLRSQVAQAEANLLQAERDVLPSLDVIASWSSDGARDGFRDAWRDSIENRYPDWSVGLEFSLPIGNSAARATRQRARLELERSRRRLHATILDVQREVRQAARDVESLAQSIRASAESVRLAVSNLDTERVKLRVGASTAFEVQRRNQDLTEARQRHLRNQLDYRVAKSRLLLVQGMLTVPR